MKLFHIQLVVMAALVAAFRAQGGNIAYLYAMEADVASFSDAGASLIRTETVGDRTINSYRLGDHTVIAMLLSSGQTESAVSTEMILARKAVDLVISTGVVGAIDEKLRVGDILSITKIVAWQTGSYGVHGWTETPRSRPSITPWKTFSSRWPEAGTASGDAFVASEIERARINSLTGMPVVDMNLLGLQVATNSHHLPALHLRIVSDRAGDGAAEEFRQFATAYKGELGRQVAEIIRTIPKNPESPESYPALRGLISNN